MMERRKLKPTDLLILLINLVPVFGVWFLGWEAREAFIIYALETIIIGFFTVLKLLLSTFHKGTGDWTNNGTKTQVSGLFFILFFVMHYGLFVLVQMTIFAASANLNPPNSSMFYFFWHWYDFVNEESAIILAIFFLGIAIRDLYPFVARGDYKRVPKMIIMFQPYGRIFIQQFIVLLGSMFLTLGLGNVFILIFAAIKIFFELWINFDKYTEKAMEEMEKEGEKVDNR